jgi:Zn-dependent protease with chaperone function
MSSLEKFQHQFSANSDTVEQNTQNDSKVNILQKLRGGFFLVLGYLLSPLCWWNDLLFNLPIAYFFGYLCSLISPKLLLPCSIIGYWLSNIVGILLMQYGSADIFQKEPTERNLKKELFTGFVSSTVYTLIIVLLIQLKIIDTPVLFANS